jgi:acrylyl-CoA reductase (NADPH)
MFRGLVVTKGESGQRAELREIDEADLPQGDVQVAVEWSTLNYKDALALTGRSPVVRTFPMVPGIDLAGTVVRSEHTSFEPGAKVVLNGWGVGETHWGGLAEKASLRGDWLVPLPSAFTTRQAMAIGTAGYTAMLCLMALEDQGVKPSNGEILVTGALGGVGSMAVSLLARLGYQVAALTGRPHEKDFLVDLGAAEVVDRSSYAAPGRPLAKERWAGAVDVVGGQVLANVCASMRYGGVVAACGLAGGMDLPVTVAPFILRGVRLIGVDSVMCPMERRLEAWKRLAELVDARGLDRIAAQAVGLEQALQLAPSLLDGQVKGRVIVDVHR